MSSQGTLEVALTAISNGASQYDSWKENQNSKGFSEGSNFSGPNVSFNSWPTSVEQSTWLVALWNFACWFGLKCILNWFCFFRLWKSVLQINWFVQHQPSAQQQPLQWSININLSTVACFLICRYLFWKCHCNSINKSCWTCRNCNNIHVVTIWTVIYGGLIFTHFINNFNFLLSLILC